MSNCMITRKEIKSNDYRSLMNYLEEKIIKDKAIYAEHLIQIIDRKAEVKRQLKDMKEEYKVTGLKPSRHLKKSIVEAVDREIYYSSRQVLRDRKKIKKMNAELKEVKLKHERLWMIETTCNCESCDKSRN